MRWLIYFLAALVICAVPLESAFSSGGKRYANVVPPAAVIVKAPVFKRPLPARYVGPVRPAWS